MAQGTRNQRKNTGPVNDDEDLLDLDAWLEQRKLAERRLRVGGRIFRFTGSGTPEKIAAFNTAYNSEAPLLELLSILLVDPGEAGELGAAFQAQAQPMGLTRLNEFVRDIISHVLAGVDVGGSSAS